MKAQATLAALLIATAATASQGVAQPWQARPEASRDAYWRDAPEGLQQRIDWLQRRIDQGLSDGSLRREEARRAQRELNILRRDANALQQRLDTLSRSLRWSRQGNRYGNSDPYVTDYDASRYYREDPRYQERRLGPNDEVYRGSDGRYYCKRSDGTTGLVIGLVGGAAIGNVIDGGRSRTAGTLIGGALGALIGKAIADNAQDNDLRCR